MIGIPARAVLLAEKARDFFSFMPTCPPLNLLLRRCTTSNFYPRFFCMLVDGQVSTSLLPPIRFFFGSFYSVGSPVFRYLSSFPTPLFSELSASSLFEIL